MVNILKVKQGISAPAVTSIPEKWDRNWFRNFITNFLVNADIRNVQGNGINITGNVSGNSTTGTATQVEISPEPIPSGTVLGNVSGSTAIPVALNSTQLTGLINDFSATLSGVVPPSGGGTTNYLRADGTFDAPPGTIVSANPSAQVGPAAVNGTAPTFMTSDSAPAANLGAVYTWTGAHTFNAGITATTVNATSDPWLKKDIRILQDSGHILDRINGYRFKWKANGDASIGVMSTEIKTVAPELVHRGGDSHDAVNYNGLVAVLIQEVQSLRARVMALEST